MILCCGEALIDMLPAEIGGRRAFLPRAGGALLNSAVALGRLGVPVGLFTGLSQDPFGAEMRAALAASNVDLSLAISSHRPATLAFVHLSGGNASYQFRNEDAADRMIGVDDLPALPRSVDALLFGGISLAAEPCASAYEALMARERSARVTMIDPNIRPAFATDEAAFRARLDRMIAMADIVKVSEDDLGWLHPGGPGAKTVARWLEAGAALVVVTRGGDGASAFARGYAVHVEAVRADVVDTVGAGDTFNAGLLAGLHERDLLTKAALARIAETDLRGALSLAAEAAAHTVSREGADPPWRRSLSANVERKGPAGDE